MPRSIKYLSYFDLQDSELRRNFLPSAANKIAYIARTIARTGREVCIVSDSEVVEPSFRLYRRQVKTLSDGISLVLPFSWGGNGRIFLRLKEVWQVAWPFLYLVAHCGRGDTVIAYHSLGYFNAVRCAKKLRGFRLILEVEEIYTDVERMPERKRRMEFAQFEAADAFIFSTQLLDKKINTTGKPSVVIHGTYESEPPVCGKFDDGKIHAVYAGTFDPAKGGAQVAVRAAEGLPENYHLHICGFGGARDEKAVRELIGQVQRRSKATITFDGLKTGREFVEFLQKCHIGLSTQQPGGAFNDSSFPSKVLTYMANGLSVVSVDIPVLRASRVSDDIAFYADEKDLPQAIMNADLSVDHRKRLAALDEAFAKDMEGVL